MADKATEQLVSTIAANLTQAMKKEEPSVFDKDFWTGRMLEFAMKDPKFKVEMFRFVDVFSVLDTNEQVAQHIKEYFLRPGQDLPAFMSMVMRGMSTSIGQKLGGGTMASQITEMAKKFITGQNTDEAIKVFTELRKENVGFTLDLLGEAALSDEESHVYLARYKEAIEQVSRVAEAWSPINQLDNDPNGAIPKVNVSIKISALYAGIDAQAFELSVKTLYDRLLPLLVLARQRNVFINLDLEQYSFKALTFELFKRLRSAKELEGYPHLGVVVQAYLKDSLQDAEELVKFAKKTKQPFTIRLVKGAYWDYETVQSQQKDWPVPVFEKKHETDANYEAVTQVLLDAFPHVRLAIGSHNLRSISHAMAYAQKQKLPKGAYEIQMLYGMAEPIRRGLVSMGERVRVYAPIGDLLPGMAYLVRRLLENTSNEGFLRQRFVEARSLDELMRAPEPAPKEKKSEAKARTLQQPFVNEAMRDFAVDSQREAFNKQIDKLKKSLPVKVPVVLGQKAEPANGVPQKRENPARRSETVAEIDYATKQQAERAVKDAHAAFPAWRDTPVEKRAQLLVKAADLMRERRDELSALMVLEVGKTPREADADVCEAIDFCEYYAREAIRLSIPRAMGSLPGEDNQLFYEPRGVAAIIAPWNFPCAILCGMTVAALVTGNTAIMKPAEQSSAIGYRVFEILRAAGIPAGVVQFLPGRGEEVGAVIANAKETKLVAFTGSRDVGLHILGAAARPLPGQDHLRKVILELGGKNAIIVDDDADLDEAVLGVVQSAFGFQGQKCSACSRVIVVGNRYDAFVRRLVEATKVLRQGAPDAFEHTFGPVVDEEAFDRLAAATKWGGKKLLGDEPRKDHGYFIPPTIITDVLPTDKLAQEELFGPVLSVLRADTFEQALQIANATSYALTGGVFSRSPLHLEQARRAYECGNLYLNRGITGALVGRQPFGGFKMSGIGSKAGGPDYLLQFVEPRVVTENTMRRGFAPETTT